MAVAVHLPGSLVTARGREWVVLPESTPDFVVARPLNGDPELIAGFLPEEVAPASFPPPTVNASEVGDNVAAGLLRTALRIGFTSSAGPFRSLGLIAVEPRQYQLVPLLLALRMDVVRLLIGDDVGIGKTIEAGLIAKELLELGEADRLAVLCPPALAEQWQAELSEKLAIETTLVLAATATRLERELRADESLFQRHRCTVVSTDFIKAERRRQQFVRTCPDLVIVDEAHTCVSGGAGGPDLQLRHQLLRELAASQQRHLILVTATPHTGNEESFRELIGLVDPALAQIDLDTPQGRERLAAHFVQRRRRDIRRYIDEETPFPQDRQLREVGYQQSPAYADFSAAALRYARGSVKGLPGDQVRQRVSWWSALALLRSVASSPRAAAATLGVRSAAGAAETVEEADALGRASVLDQAVDDALEGIDAVPGADDERLPASTRERLRTLARLAATLEGPEADVKLARLIEMVEALLVDGYDPIVFCRFIPTAEYIAEHLVKALNRRARVAAVTGTLQPAERRAHRAADLCAGPPRAGGNGLSVGGGQPPGALPGGGPLRPGMEPHPPRAARGPGGPLRPTSPRGPSGHDLWDRQRDRRDGAGRPDPQAPDDRGPDRGDGPDTGPG